MENGTLKHYTAKQAQEIAGKLLEDDYSLKDVEVLYDDEFDLPYTILVSATSISGCLKAQFIVAQGNSWHEALEALQREIKAGKD